MTKIIHIDGIQTNSIDRKLQNNIEPIIFTNSITSWAAIKHWNPAYFREKFGSLKVIVNYNLPEKESPYLVSANKHSSLMKISDFIELMLANKSCYIAQENINSFELLKNDYHFVELLPSSESANNLMINLWIGTNTRSGLHFDMYDNFLAQVYGEKKVILIAPSDTGYVYPLPENIIKSPLNPFEPNFVKFPKFKHATLYEGEIKAGDVLFIPKGWWHYIYSPKDSISLNCWYGSPLSKKALLNALLKSGWRSYVSFIRDFIRYGLLQQPFEYRLYSPSPTGKTAYDMLTGKFKL